MKRIITIFSYTLIAISLFAQTPLNIFKSDSLTQNFQTSDIDSIKFNADKTQMMIFNKNNSVTDISLSAIDSINFDATVAAKLPVIDSVMTNSVSNTYADISFKTSSSGESAVTEQGVCWSKNQNPTKGDNMLMSTTLLPQQTVKITNLTAGTTYYVRAFATNSTGTTYSSQIVVTTTNYSYPSVQIVSSTYYPSTNLNLCVVKVSSDGGCNLTQRGICWSEKGIPTTGDSVYSNGTFVGQFSAPMRNIELNKTYYVRAFATNCLGTAYSPMIKVTPLPGAVTFTLNIDSVAHPTAYKLIKIAMDSACWYYNRYTTFKGNVWVTYNSGVPTAQADYHGTISFGSNTTYMWVGTAMHEMAHYMGSGTTSQWQALSVNGLWTGKVASTLLKNATGETLHCDSQHFWPYGINYKSEITSLGSITNQQNALIMHCKLVEAMVVDDAGLPSSW